MDFNKAFDAVSKNVTNSDGLNNAVSNMIPNTNGLPNEMENPLSAPDDFIDLEEPFDDIEGLDEPLIDESLIDENALDEAIDAENPNMDEVNDGPAPGDKVAPGEVIGEDGNVEKSAVNKVGTAIGRGFLAYATGGESLGKDKEIINNPLGKKAIGVVSDIAEKAPGVKEAAEAIDETGIADVANDAMDAVGSIKNGDIGGAVEDIKKTSESLKKSKEKTRKKVVQITLSVLGPFLAIAVTIIVICGPVIGGFLDMTQGDSTIDYNSTNTPTTSTDINETVSTVTDDYSNLSEERQAILAAAISILGSNYYDGGKPTGSGIDGIPYKGLDNAGYVQWVLWTAFDENPGNLTTQAISDLIGTRFVEITADELQPGDIALKYKGYDSSVENHVGIYAGNNRWMHAKNENSGIVNGTYNEFTVYLRYEKVG